MEVNRSRGLRDILNEVYGNKGRDRVRVNEGKGRVGVNIWKVEYMKSKK